jgi:hypothetical protein
VKHLLRHVAFGDAHGIRMLFSRLFE